MKNLSILLVYSLIILTSCSSGKKSLQKGDYFSAIITAVQRLNSAPDNKKAVSVLYHFALLIKIQKKHLVFLSTPITGLILLLRMT